MKSYLLFLFPYYTFRVSFVFFLAFRRVVSHIVSLFRFPYIYIFDLFIYFLLLLFFFSVFRLLLLLLVACSFVLVHCWPGPAGC
jgi:hypothetical protein